MTATNLTAHAVVIETFGTVGGIGGLGGLRHRWRCSCGCPPGEWRPRAFTARQGGTQHPRMMERGKTSRSAP